ncbi:ribosome hibernation-promoting factor, HPF/YfiA family [candidate division CSSED10-310 bacterium]|uniref:Ribosome hibernation promoting factor n=1 Tax=candidate division CSSED10-310 bacterium TaxID=2855610 RepID=A0ABV6Z2W0_UNCC1
MKITITSRRMEITQPLRDYIHNKVNKLSRYKDNINEAHVILSVEKYRQNAEIYISGNGFSLSSAEETSDMYTSIDVAIDKLERQAKKLKNKKIDIKRGAYSRNNVVTWDQEVDEEEKSKKVVRLDAFIPKPMSVEEAIMQLEARGDDILMFRNARNDEINVIYLRPDGDIGLIEPEY